MEKILFVLIVSIVFLSGCSANSYDSLGDESVKGCESPSNPYNDGGGHDAGFNWAEEKDVGSCGGKSDSFIEGCEEYLRQQSRYEKCIDN